MVSNCPPKYGLENIVLLLWYYSQPISQFSDLGSLSITTPMLWHQTPQRHKTFFFHLVRRTSLLGFSEIQDTTPIGTYQITPLLVV